MTTIPSQSTFDFVPLHLLSLSPENVRKHYSEDSIVSLASMIQIDGVLQNLVVYPAPKTARTRSKGFLVGAGGRRWRALTLLLKQGHIDKNFPVPCQIRSAEGIAEISLAENVGQEPMHPADEFDAYKKVVDSGATVGEVALRFGVKPLHVQQRLRLANVHPHFISMYREQKITLEHLMALALTDDHERQMKVWAALPDWRRSPDEIRDILTEKEIPGDDPLALLVGTERYEQAGGFVRRDLFAEGDDTYFTDPELLRSLAESILEGHARTLRDEGAPWVEVVAHLGVPTRAKFVPVKKRRQEPTPEIASQLGSLRKRAVDLTCELEPLDADDLRYDALEAELSEADETIDAIEQSLLQPDPEDLAVAGAIITVADDGSVRVERYVRREDMPKTGGGSPGTAESHKAGESANRTHSIALTRRLTSHRTAALQATVARQPTVALLALTHRLVADVLYHQPLVSALQIDSRTVSVRSDLDGVEKTSAHIALESLRDQARASLPEDPQLLFQWLADQTQETLLRLLAVCAASCINGVRDDDNLGPSIQLARAAHLDMHEWWRPTATEYFASLKTARILEIIREVRPDQSEAPLRLMRKPALALTAEEIAVPAGWLPALLRAPETTE